MSLESQPRFPLATLPTPIQEARRLREALGGPRRSPRILIKRDDLTGLAFGGNKVRKLEFLTGDALRAGATVLVTSGAVQSNHARTTAAAARVAGMGASLVLTGQPEGPTAQGNLLLDHLLGAEVHFAGDDPGAEAAAVATVMESLRQRGERPYLIPIGGSSPAGALGYVAASLEITEQLAALGEAPVRLYFPAGSRGTQAGLTLGARICGATYRLCGIAVSGGEEEKKARAARVANAAAELMGAAARVGEEDFQTHQEYIGPGYAVPTPGCLEAIRMLARHEGIFLDPVYTGKAMAGLIDHIVNGEIDASSTVLFLHTGGTPALFAFADQLQKDSIREDGRRSLS